MIKRALIAVLFLFVASPVVGASTPNDPRFPEQWALTLTNTDDAWATTTGSSSVIIANIGSGTYAHPDLAGKLVPGRDIINNDSDPSETSGGHGTATTGIAGAAVNNGLAVATYCWACRVMPVKIYQDGSTTWSAIASGIRWAADRGATIITMSFTGGSNSGMLDALRYAQSKGVILIAAGGSYPAAYPEVIGTVGVNSDGTNAEGRNADIGVPYCNWTLNVSGDGTHEFCAASSTSPALASIVGLAKSLYPAATQAQIVAALQSSGRPIPGYTTRLVDTAAFLAALGGTPSSPTASPSPTATPVPTATPTATATPTPRPTFCDRHPSHRRCNP